MSGAGNDFVVFDDRDEALGDDDLDVFVRRLCSRRLSVGADGVLLLRRSRRASFRLVYFNSDGSRAAFCGNGTRCAARFAFVHVISAAHMTIETDWAVIGADVDGNKVALALPDVEGVPEKLELALPGGTAHVERLVVGVPHAMMFADRPVAELDVERYGAVLRHHPGLGPEGANASFVRVVSEHEAELRTFERGVERETLACGSAVVAVALTALHRGVMRPPVMLRPRSGIPLEVSASVMRNGFGEVRLAGDARIVYRSRLSEETVAGFPEEAVGR